MNFLYFIFHYLFNQNNLLPIKQIFIVYLRSRKLHFI